ncbi:MAG: DNA replication protein DnaC [Clostridiales bacterium]|jgi:DNA replication protein DnaC|nr:MAG: DNA replication protein DnaC [Clostridiales bacterium]
MSYEPEVLRRAYQRMKEGQRLRAEAFASKKAMIYHQLPRVQAIDRQLRQGVVQAATAALKQGVDPAPAIQALRAESKALQAERKDLLTQAGYREEDLVEQPQCQQCRDTGWCGSTMCVCLRALCAEEQVRSLSSLLDLQGQSFDAFRLDYYPDDPGPNGVSPRSHMKLVRDICQGYAARFECSGVKNLFLSGSPGLGKTFLSACIARVVSERGYSVVYDTAIHVFGRFEAEKFGREENGSTLRYLKCDLLILDDLGSELTTPFIQSALYELVNTRLITGKHTVISSNLSLRDIALRYSGQVSSRIAGEYRLLEFWGEDIRKLKNSSF